MDYYLLADMTVQIGYELAVAGAETYRVEETMRRVIEAYGTEGQAFAIPNCVAESFVAPNAKPLPIMKRVGYHGNDLERIEKLNALSRRICAEVPAPEEAQRWRKEPPAAVRRYAGNPLFRTLAASFLMALPAYVAAGLGWLDCVAVVIIGALMLLVPGLLITNSMRDIIYGDTSSGVSRIVQVLLSAFAIALGTAAAWHVTTPIYGHAETVAALTYPLWAQGIAN